MSGVAYVGFMYSYERYPISPNVYANHFHRDQWVVCESFFFFFFIQPNAENLCNASVSQPISMRTLLFSPAGLMTELVAVLRSRWVNCNLCRPAFSRFNVLSSIINGCRSCSELECVSFHN